MNLAVAMTAEETLDLKAQPPTEYLGPLGCIRYRISKLGIKICNYFWPAHRDVPVKAIIVIAHGHGNYLCFDWLKPQGPGLLNVYEGSFIQRLNAAGYAVCGNDDRGAGRSDGLRCYCESFNEYVDDVLENAKMCDRQGITSFQEGLPKYLLGASRGAAVLLTAALKEPDMFAGLIGLSPMVSLEKVAKAGLNPYLRPIGSLLSYMIPESALLSARRNEKFPDIQALYDADPNCYHEDTRVRNAQEYLLATEWLAAHQRRLRLPLLLFHSEEDTQTDPEGTKRLFREAESEDKTFISPPGMWHILMKEPGHQEIQRQILEWLDKRSTVTIDVNL